MLFHSQLAKCHGEGGSLICKPDSQDARNPVPPSPSTVAAENYEGEGQLGSSLGADNHLHPPPVSALRNPSGSAAGQRDGHGRVKRQTQGRA